MRHTTRDVMIVVGIIGAFGVAAIAATLAAAWWWGVEVAVKVWAAAWAIAFVVALAIGAVLVVRGPRR